MYYKFHENLYQKAFSLIELLVAISLIAISLSIAIPSLRQTISKNYAIMYANELMVALQFTRAAAIWLGEPVIFCGSKDHITCNGSWQDSLIVVTAKTGKVMRVMPAVFAKDKLIWRGSFGTTKAITFLPQGFTNGLQGSFYYCPKNSLESTFAVILNSIGRVRIVNELSKEKRILCNF